MNNPELSEICDIIYVKPADLNINESNSLTHTDDESEMPFSGNRNYSRLLRHQFRIHEHLSRTRMRMKVVTQDGGSNYGN